MKKIFVALVLLIAASYIVPIPQVRDPVNHLISSVLGDAGWLMKDKKCNTPLEQRQKGYCADK